MRNKLNIFEYYSQSGVLPIENNATRNLSIVLRSNPLCFEVFIRLLEKKIQIRNPQFNLSNNSTKVHRSVDIQQRITSLQYNIDQIIGVALTTNSNLTYDRFVNPSSIEKNGQITDIVIEYDRSLIIIEAKRTKEDARSQLDNQINEFIKVNEIEDNITPVLEAITWDEIIHDLMELNNLTDGRNTILNDYILHIQDRVPEFLPIVPFSRLGSNQNSLIAKRIDFVSENFTDKYENFIIDRKSGVPWIAMTEETVPYIKMFALFLKNSDLELHYHLGNNIYQGRHLYSNKLGILNHNSISINGLNFELNIRPYIKISNSWGSWIAEVSINSKEPEVLKSMFKTLCKRYSRKDVNEIDLRNIISNYSSYINTDELISKIKDLSYDTFTFSLSLHVSILGLYEFFREVDTQENTSEEISLFLNNALDRLINLIE